MKNIGKYLGYLIILICLLSCNKETVPSITINTENIHFNYEAAAVSISLTADRPWRATSSVDWCRSIPSSGSSTARPVEIIVFCDRNLTDDSRIGVLSFEIDGCSTSLNISQDCEDIVVLNTDIEISSDKQMVEVSVAHKTEFSFEIKDCEGNWLQKLETKSMEQSTLAFEACENISAARSCRIVISGGDIHKEVIIRQKASDIEIPDPYFREFCMAFDTNSDGCLSKDEALKVKELSLSRNQISWKGIENFTELEKLAIPLKNAIPDFRVFHNLRDLSIIHLSSEKLINLDLSLTGQLQNVHVSGAEINSLDLRNNRHLKGIDSYIDYKDINLNGCDSLRVFTCSHNWQLQSLDLCSNPMVTSLSISDCNWLQQINLGDKPFLTELNCAGNRWLAEITITDGSKIKTINCYDCNLSKLDLTACPELSELFCHNNNLSDLNLSNCGKLSVLNCYNNELTSLDLKNNQNLDEIDAHSNPLDYLYCNNCTSLRKLSCWGCSLKELLLGGCTSLEYLDCYDNNLSDLDLSDCGKLSVLNCYYNKLTGLDLKSNQNLDEINARNNPLDYLYCSNCTSLRSLCCYGGSLKELLLDGCTSLQYLNCHDNNLSDLDLSDSGKLTTLYCGNNELTNLDIRNNQKLEELSVDNNPLNYIDCNIYPSLIRLSCEGCSLKELPLGGCTSLRYLNCPRNYLTMLDLSRTEIDMLDCRENPNLEIVYIPYGRRLAFISYDPDVTHIIEK